MRQQVNDDRIQARQLLYVSQEIIKLKLRLDEELARVDSSHNQSHPWLNDGSLTEIMRRINYELESEKESRQVRKPFSSDHQSTILFAFTFPFRKSLLIILISSLLKNILTNIEWHISTVHPHRILMNIYIVVVWHLTN